MSVEVSATEQAKIGFAPLENRAIVSDSPIGDLNFHAIKADIEGHVQCLAEDCGSSLEVSLKIFKQRFCFVYLYLGSFSIVTGSVRSAVRHFTLKTYFIQPYFYTR